MKKQLKKFCAVALTAILAASAVSFSASAANGPQPLDPDTMYAWGGASLQFWGENRYTLYDALDDERSAPEGASYDLATNTLTLTDVNMPDYELSVRMMGDDFTLKIVGDCALQCIYVNDYVYNTVLTITGSGTLDVNKNLEDTVPVSFYGGEAQKQLAIDAQTSVNLYSPESSNLIFRHSSSRSADSSKEFVVGGTPVSGVEGEEIMDEVYDKLPGAYRNPTDTSSYYHGTRLVSKSDPDGIYAAYAYVSNPDVFYLSRYKYYEAFDLYATDLDFSPETGNLVKIDRADMEEQYDYYLNDEGSRVSYYTQGSFVMSNMNVYLDENGTKYLADYRSNIYQISESNKITLGGEEYYLATYNENIKPEYLISTMREEHTGYYNYALSGTEFHSREGVMPAQKLGDVNGDGEILVDDATLVQKHAAGLDTLTGAALDAADVNHDGKVDVADATQIQKFAAGLISEF